LLRLNHVTGVSLADVVILAELALEVTPVKKDGARPTPATQWIFFAQVGAITTYFGLLARAAYAHLPGSAVNPATPGAHIADRKVLVCLGNALPKLAAAQKLEIGWFEATFFSQIRCH